MITNRSSILSSLQILLAQTSCQEQFQAAIFLKRSELFRRRFAVINAADALFSLRFQIAVRIAQSLLAQL